MLRFFSVSSFTRRRRRRAAAEPSYSRRRCLPAKTQPGSLACVSRRHNGFGGGAAFTLIMLCREPANSLLNSALMSSRSTSLRLTITLIRVLSSVPAPCHTNTSDCDEVRPFSALIRLCCDLHVGTAGCEVGEGRLIRCLSANTPLSYTDTNYLQSARVHQVVFWKLLRLLGKKVARLLDYKQKEKKSPLRQ